MGKDPIKPKKEEQTARTKIRFVQIKAKQEWYFYSISDRYEQCKTVFI